MRPGRLLVSAHNELISPVGERREPAVRRRARYLRLGRGRLRPARQQRRAVPRKRRPGPARPEPAGQPQQRPREQQRPGGAAGRRRRKGPVMTPPPLQTPPPLHTPPVRTRPVESSNLTVLNLPMSDPRVRPLLDELALEYDTRYGNLFGRGAAAEELNRYPAEEFAAPGGALLIVRENGESVAGGAFRRHGPQTRRVQADLDAFGTPPPGPGPFCPGRTGGAGRPPRLPEGLPDHRSPPAGGETPLPENRLRGPVRPLRGPGNHRTAGIHQGPARRVTQGPIPAIECTTGRREIRAVPVSPQPPRIRGAEVPGSNSCGMDPSPPSATSRRRPGCP